ncbi:MAG: EamA family transporter [Deltaproteobacteria bacterium]|nr:EamA family transporter [Deltaproteobacteria bacterium]
MWFFLALAGALFQVLRNMSMKHLGHALDNTINVWSRVAFILPFAGAAVMLEGVPVVGEGFWVNSMLFGVTQGLGTLSLSRALSASSISLVTALWKMSLVLLVVVGYVVLGEIPTPVGLAGVGVSLVGVYLLNVQFARISPWAPLAALVNDPGQRWTLAAACCYAPSVVLIKQMALSSSVPFSILAGYSAATALLTPYALYRSRRNFRRLINHWPSLLGLGAFGSLGAWFSTTAYTFTVSSYVEAVKQVEVLFALAIGYLVFNEGATVRLIWPGAAVIMAGLVLLKVGG